MDNEVDKRNESATGENLGDYVEEGEEPIKIFGDLPGFYE